MEQLFQTEEITNLGLFSLSTPDKVDFYGVARYHIHFVECEKVFRNKIIIESNIEHAILLSYFERWHKFNVEAIHRGEKPRKLKSLAIVRSYDDIKRDLQVRWGTHKMVKYLKFLIGKNGILRADYSVKNKEGCFFYNFLEINRFVEANYKVKHEGYNDIHESIKKLQDAGYIVTKREEKRSNKKNSETAMVTGKLSQLGSMG